MYNWFSYLYIFNGSTIQNTITSTFLHMQLVWFWVDRLFSKTWVQLVMITSTTICQKKKKEKKICSFKVPTTHSRFILSIVLISAVSASTQKPTTRFSAVVPVLKCQPQCSCAQRQYLKANHITTLCCQCSNSHLKSWPQFVCVCVWSTSFCCGRCT